MFSAFSPGILLGAEKGVLDFFDPRLLLAGGMLSGSLLLFAIILVLVKRWRKKQEAVMPSASEQLNSYRQLLDEGDLSKEEFDRIRTRLLDRMRKETGLDEKLTAPTGPSNQISAAETKPGEPPERPPQDMLPGADGKPSGES